MIGSLLASVVPNSSLGVTDSGGGEAPATREVNATPRTHIAAFESDDGARGHRLGRHDFVHAAKHMVKDALKTFSHDLRDSFHDLGFKSDMIMRLAHDVMQAAKEALKSGADFTANLMMAAVSQTTITSASGSESLFDMVASEIEITINHSTGSVEINATQVEIHSQLTISGGTTTPRLVDFVDTDGDEAPPVLAMGDLEAILASGENDGEAEALAPVLAGLPDDEPAAPDETDEADDTEVAATEEGDGELGATVEDGDIVPVPEITGVSHIIITAFERYLNSEEEQITYIKLDAVIPLSTAAPDDSITEAVAEDVIEEIVEPTEIPVIEQVIEEPVGQTATTDLVA